jgi:hypothetical protein
MPSDDPHQLSLFADDLERLANTLRILAQTQIMVPFVDDNNHRVYVKRFDSQMDGITWVITGIERR